MIIAVGGQKGGSGKSLFVANLAAAFANKGYLVHIEDNDDDQGTITNWLRRRYDSHRPVPLVGSIQIPYSTLPDIKIIDLQGADSTRNRLAIRQADVWIVPVKASQADQETLGRVMIMVQQVLAEKPSLIFELFINEAPTTNATEVREWRQWMDEHGFEAMKTVIHSRKSYRESFKRGLGVIEMEGRGHEKAASEFMELYEELAKVYDNLLSKVKTSNRIFKQEQSAYGS